MADNDGAGSDLHPYGSGSHDVLPNEREMPACYPIKGIVRNDGTKLYHRPDSRNYGATTAEVWFDSPSAAEAAGFEPAATHPRGSTGAEYEPGRSGHPCTVTEVDENRAASAGLTLVGAGVGSALPGGVVLGDETIDTDLHPYGVGSHRLLDDADDLPDCYPIKGTIRNDGSKLYHRPDSRSFASTRAEAWFDSPSAAEAAGFVLAPTHPRDSSAADFEPGGSGHPCTTDRVNANRAAAAGVDLDDGESSGTGGLAAAGAAGAVLAGAATVAGLDGDGDATAVSSSDDVAGPSGDALLGAIGGADADADVGSDVDADADVESDSPSDVDAASDGEPDDDGDAGRGPVAGAAAAAGAGGLAAAAAQGGDADDTSDAASAATDAEVTTTSDAATATTVAGGEAAAGDAGKAARAASDKAKAKGNGKGQGKGKGGRKAGGAAAAGAAGAVAAGAAATGSKNREEIERGIASARAGVDSRADKVPSTVGQPRGGAKAAAGGRATAETTRAAVAGGGDRAAPLAGRAGGDGGAFGLGRWLWMGLGLLALVLLLGWLLSRCGDDEDTSATGGDADVVDPSGPDAATDDDAVAADDTVADSSTDDSAADGSTTTTEAEESTTTSNQGTDLQALAVAALADAGFGEVDVEVDGDSIRLVGELGSEDDRTAAEAAVSALSGVGSVTNEITVADEATDLQASAAAALADAGFGEVDVEVDGDSIRLVGELGSEDDRTAAEAAVSALSGVGSVTNEITVAGETPTADATEGDPSYTG